MAAAESMLDDIEGAIARADARRRRSMLRQITNLFVEHARRLDEDVIGAFDDIMMSLAADVDFRVRHAVSERLADLPTAPFRVVRDFAFDDAYEVATPVLMRSPRLCDEDLVLVVQTKSAMHVLAVARRPTLSERVTDSIIARNETDPLRALAVNEGALFSEEGFAALMRRSQDDEEIQQALSYRGELTPEQATALADAVRDKTRRSLVDELGERMESAIDAVIADLQKKFVPDRGRELMPADLEMARQFVAARVKDQGITDSEMGQWIKRNRMEDVLAAIASIIGIDIGKVVNAFYAPRFDAILFCASAAGMSWGNFKSLLAKRSARQPSMELLEEAYNVFQRLKPDTAKRVVRFAVSRGRPVPVAARKPKIAAPAEPEKSHAASRAAPAPSVETASRPETGLAGAALAAGEALKRRFWG
ncbi:MAG: DUF2336 domain-containing protein [Microvirga sp.]|nr:DUF2336 domain-containing protein [Microvirga sp.]